ncbi:MAG TPA: hypothetical protein VN213_19700 [Solirubrobacteraceae bacterium]|nr:hypothetical protein [Solirubrobacteraceae bacterium]
MLVDGPEGEPAVATEEAREALRRIVGEALLLQDLAEDILEGVRAQRPLCELARPGGVLAGRFVALRRALPACGDAELRRHRDVVARVLDHHAMMLSAALDLLAADWRSERMREQLERIDGLGGPARWLRAVGEELGATRRVAAPR